MKTIQTKTYSSITKFIFSSSFDKIRHDLGYNDCYIMLDNINNITGIACKDTVYTNYNCEYFNPFIMELIYLKQNNLTNLDIELLDWLNSSLNDYECETKESFIEFLNSMKDVYYGGTLFTNNYQIIPFVQKYNEDLAQFLWNHLDLFQETESIKELFICGLDSCAVWMYKTIIPVVINEYIHILGKKY